MVKSQSSRQSSAVSPGWKWALPVLVLLLAVALRLWRLDSVPPGLTHDEANNVHDAVSVLRGARPFYFPVAQGKEPLYLYSVALMMALVGPTPFAMRLTSAFWGLLLVVLTYAWTRRSFGRPTALWAAAGLSLSFWGVSTSRMGLRAITLPVLLTAALIASRLAQSKGPRFTDSIVAGLCLGLTFYTYLAARAMPFLLALFGLYLFLTRRERWSRCWRSWLGMLIVAAAVAAPLFLYLRAHPAAEIRIGQLDRPLRALLSGDFGPLLKKALKTLQAFSFRGDGFIPYNIPGRPIFDPLMSLLFYAGLAVALRRWRDPAHALALLWLAVGFLPALATGVDASYLRAIGAQPALFIFPALALGELRSLRLSRLRLSWLVGGLALALVAFLTLRDYFVRWPDDRDVRVHYHVNLMAVADALRGWNEDKPVAISALYPMQYHDPRIVQAALGDSSPAVCWFDGRQALLIPPAPAAGLILPAAVPLDQMLWAFVEPHATLLERVALRPDDFNPYFELYRWSAEETLAALQATMAAPACSDRLPLGVGEWLSFQGYQLREWTGSPGGEFGLLTLWRVEAPLPDDRDAVIFTQLLDGRSQVVAQQDRLGAPSWGWRRGDAILQLHRLALPEGTPPGQYTLIAGVYTAPDRVDAVLAGREPDPAMPRLLVYEQGELLDDNLVLKVLEVK